MATIDELKKRKKSITTIHKITKAMELVAIAKTRKYFSIKKNVENYFNEVYEIYDEIIQAIDDFDSPLFNTNDHNQKTLWILVTSDLGLCGSYNNNLFKFIKDKIKKEDIIFSKGFKGTSILKKRLNCKIEKSWIHIKESDFYQNSKEIVEEAKHLYLSKKVNKIMIAWTSYVNQITFKPKILQILPLRKEMFKQNLKNSESKQSNKLKRELVFENSQLEVLYFSILQYVTSIVFNAIAEANLSEHSSRRLAMEAAKRNGQDLLEDLEIEFNKFRQEKITQEISEIVSGSEN